MKQRKKGGGGANWMDTYGDMVTLLLCFFVLLYSISTVSDDKWKALVLSFNPNAVQVATQTPGGEGPNADVDDPPTTPLTQGEVDEKMDDLYEELKEYVAQQDAENNISVTKGAGYVFISFNQAVFFDGDRAELRQESFPVLDTICGMLSSVSDAIDEVQVLGHTAQESPERPNKPKPDRFLASDRATNVTVYIQEHSTVPPGRLVSVGYGQHRPVSENKTSEDREKNRRVELIVAGKNVESKLGDSIEQYYSTREGKNPLP